MENEEIFNIKENREQINFIIIFQILTPNQILIRIKKRSEMNKEILKISQFLYVEDENDVREFTSKLLGSLLKKFMVGSKWFRRIRII